MNIFENYGEILLQQHDGNRQLASALAGSVQALVRRLANLLVVTRRHVPGEHPLR